jgi:hypothetical protein
MKVFFTKTLSIEALGLPVKFSTENRRNRALDRLDDGDVVVYSATAGAEPMEFRNRLLGYVEVTKKPVLLRDYDLPEHYHSELYNIVERWEYGIENHQSWEFENKPKITELYGEFLELRRLNNYRPTATGLVEITDPSLKDFLLSHPRRPFQIVPAIRQVRPIFRAIRPTYRRAPPPANRQYWVDQVLKKAADTYVFEIRGTREPAFKIGWSNSAPRRMRYFNKYALPQLGGLKYVEFHVEHWKTGADAEQMEQSLLARFRNKLFEGNQEVVIGVTAEDMMTAIKEFLEEASPD